MSSARKSVLVGFADAVSAPEVAASLLGAGYRVVAFTRRGRPVALTRLRGVELVEVTPPEVDLDTCLGEIRHHASHADVAMPLNDAGLFVCDAALDEDALVAGPRGDQARLALDKRLQLHAAQDAGLLVPAWVDARGSAKIPPEWDWPVVLKPVLAAEPHAGRLRRLSPRLVGDRHELDRQLERWGSSTPVVVQRRLHGVGTGLFGLADDAGIHHLSAHRRVRMMNPAGSGSSACVSAPIPSTGLVTAAERLLVAAGWTGMFMIEMLYADGRHGFMELNGRAWGSLALSRRLGFEYAAWVVAKTLDQGSQIPEAPPFRELLCRNLGRELVHLSYVLRGSRLADAGWPSRWTTLRSLLRPTAHTAWYNLAPELHGVFLYDTWRTVCDQTWGKRR